MKKKRLIYKNTCCKGGVTSLPFSSTVSTTECTTASISAILQMAQYPFKAHEWPSSMEESHCELI